MKHRKLKIELDGDRIERMIQFQYSKGTIDVNRIWENKLQRAKKQI